jgi:carboxymethylenebutenolidase
MDLIESQLLSLLPKTNFSRRAFVMTGLTSGFALACQPVAATTITTDTNGLVAGEVKIPVADGEIPAFRAMPATGGPFPVIVAIAEVYGVHYHLQDLCLRLAHLGYFAIAPEPFARQGDPGKLTDLKDILQQITSKKSDAEMTSDIDATIAWLKTDAKADTKRLGMTGFCWGGRQTWLYLAHNHDIKAAVAWYGGPLIGTSTPMKPKNPIDVVSEIETPVLALHGGADEGIPVVSIEKMKAAMKEAGKTAEFVIYPDTPHGFAADYRAAYREGPAKDGWKRMLDWFKKYGVA